jgi:hypothetical protein
MKKVQYMFQNIARATIVAAKIVVAALMAKAINLFSKTCPCMA